MNVSDIMKKPAPRVSPDTRVAEVVRAVLEGGSAGVAVIDADGRLVGLVSERDLVERHARPHAPRYLGILGGILPWDSGRADEDMRHILAVTAADLMSDDPATIAAGASVDDAATVMLDQEANPLVVLDGSAVAGLLSHADIVRLLVIEESDDG